MQSQLPVIVIVLPLGVCFGIFLTGWWVKRAGHILAVAALGGCAWLSIRLLHSVIGNGPQTYWLGGWQPPWGIEYRIDYLNGAMLVLVSTLSFLIALFAQRSVERELPGKTALFWCLYILMITGLLGICATGDLFNLFVMLEVASLSGYALIAMGERGALYAGFRYLVIGTVGAAFYLQGVGLLYIATGSLNIADLSRLLVDLQHSRVVLTGHIFILIGLSIKMALFPLHGWLPDAYARAPSAVSAMIAPLMTKVMAYVVIRVLFTLFDVHWSFSLLGIDKFLVWFGTLAILFGGLMALSQTDYKRMLSYVIIAEIGFIVGGIGVANATAMKGAVFHIINGALMAACLFLVAGMVTYRTGNHGIKGFENIFRDMPLTAAIFLVGALAVIGVPPTCGFFSKWYLLLGGIQAGQWGFVGALLLCTLINAALFFRVVDKGLFTHDKRAGAAQGGQQTRGMMREAPITMLIPGILLAVAILLIGIFNQVIIQGLIRFTVPAGI